MKIAWRIVPLVIVVGFIFALAGHSNRQIEAIPFWFRLGFIVAAVTSFGFGIEGILRALTAGEQTG